MELAHYKMPWAPLVVAPLGDIQWNGDANEIALDSLKRHIATAMAKEAWFIGLGDYIDFASPSNRAKLAAADLYDGPLKTLDDIAHRLVDEVYEILKPTKGRWLGLLEGHHFYQFRSGMTTDMKLAEMLGTKFLGTSAYVALSFARHHETNGDKVTSYIWAHHGRGSGKAHAPIMKLENLTPYWEADVFLIAHMTKLATAALLRIYPSFIGKTGKLRHKRISLVGTGGWSKAYMEGATQGIVPRGGYVERDMMNPVCLGAPFVYLVPHRRDRGRGESRTVESTVNITVEL